VATTATRPSRPPEAPGGEPIIRTVALTKRYGGAGGVLAVDDLDLEVGAGEVFGLLGPNGAGKTTTIGMLTTRVRPTSGRAYVGGVDVAADPAGARALIGVLSQHNTLDRSLSVADNLYFHGRYFGLGARGARARTAEMLERFRLADRADAPVAALSGGMAQRLMLARAVAHRPATIFLDEPTAGLDPQSRLALWDILRELNADGQTVLLTTHFMEEADVLCDRVAIMDHGRILALDAPEALKRTVGAAAVISLELHEAAPDGLAGRLAGIERVRGVEPAPGGLRVLVEGDAPHLLPRLVDEVSAAGGRLSAVSVSETTLETVFIHLTGRELRE
jgi:ABC-2 type transport system ATP-binding protein